jgi:hypothetical protein
LLAELLGLPYGVLVSDAALHCWSTWRWPPTWPYATPSRGLE